MDTAPSLLIKLTYMKRILSIILAAFALLSCDPAEKTNDSFSADNILDTRWKGTWRSLQGSIIKEQSEVTLKFTSADKGTFIQKRSSSPSKDSYQMQYAVSGKNITFDCPVINGTWAVSDYTEKTMTLTLLPDKNGIMILVKE